MPPSAPLFFLTLVIVSVVLFLLYRPPRWIISSLAKRAPAIIYYARVDQPVMALTIDDGPDAESTLKILKVLEKHGTQATFFLISSRVEGNEEVVRQIVQRGHEIGNHLSEEVPSALLSADEFDRALASSHKILSSFAIPRWFRPGSGWINQRIQSKIQEYEYRCVMGSVYPYDGQIRSAWFSQRFIRANAFPGGILVLHDGGSRGLRTAAVLGDILPDFMARGWRITTLSNLIDLSDNKPGEK
jgi:peptidoglycan/xylan/chitin deacetylase (PgdA/CDA1 family)